MFKDGFYPADILLPKYADMEKWAIVACDQFTSQPEYWEKASDIVGNAPSALNVILPEVYLEDDDVAERIEKINENMEDYLSQDVFTTYEDSLIYVERLQSDGTVRHGLVGKVDLEAYDFTPGSGALIRATEGTVLSRIPPRVKVRENAAIELPHAMVLIDDPEKTVIEPLTEAAKNGDDMSVVYDFDLMLGGGHIKGYLVGKKHYPKIAAALSNLATAKEMEKKYAIKDAKPLLFAMGDGNHSLATAKQCYENLKKTTPLDEAETLRARYALVEVVNNHDDALKFEPIHRVLFNVDYKDVLNRLKEYYPDCEISPSDSYEKSINGENSREGCHVFAAVTADGNYEIVIKGPKVQLEVGSLQEFLDDYLKKNSSVTVDYVHGDETTAELGRRSSNMAFLVPGMGKDQLFKTVMADGVLPRKTFSMGHAEDKRYYIEAREI